MEKERFYSTQEVGRIFGVTSYTVRKWIREGQISAIKISGKFWRVKESEVKRLAESKYQLES